MPFHGGPLYSLYLTYHHPTWKVKVNIKKHYLLKYLVYLTGSMFIQKQRNQVQIDGSFKE